MLSIPAQLWGNIQQAWGAGAPAQAAPAVAPPAAGPRGLPAGYKKSEAEQFAKAKAWEALQAGSGSFDRRTDRGAIAPKPAPAAAVAPPAVAAVADRRRADAASANHSVKPQAMAVPEGYESFETYNARPYAPSAERQVIGEDGTVMPRGPYTDFRAEQRAAFLDADDSMGGIWAQRRMLADQAAANGHQLQAADWRNMDRRQLEQLAASRYEGGEPGTTEAYGAAAPGLDIDHKRAFEMKGPLAGVNLAEEGLNVNFGNPSEIDVDVKQAFDPNVNVTGRMGDEVKNRYMQFGLRDRIKNNPDNRPLSEPVDPAEYSAAQVFKASPQLSIRDNALASAAAVGMDYQPDANSPEALAAANIWGSRNGKGVPDIVTKLDLLDPDELGPLNQNYRISGYRVS